MCSFASGLPFLLSSLPSLSSVITQSLSSLRQIMPSNSTRRCTNRSTSCIPCEQLFQRTSAPNTRGCSSSCSHSHPEEVDVAHSSLACPQSGLILTSTQTGDSRTSRWGPRMPRSPLYKICGPLYKAIIITSAKRESLDCGGSNCGQAVVALPLFCALDSYSRTAPVKVTVHFFGLLFVWR